MKLKIIFFIAITCIAIIISGLIIWEFTTNQQVNENFEIKMQYFTGIDEIEESDIYWELFNINQYGEASFIRYIDHDILEAKYNNFSNEELDFLTCMIENMNFFDLNNSYEHKENITCDSGFTEISIDSKTRSKSVYAHCDLGPNEFYELRERIRVLIDDFIIDKYGVFIKSKDLAKEKYESIKSTLIDREGIANVENGFVNLSLDELKNYSNLSESILNPLDFFYVGSKNNTEVDNFIINRYNYFFVETDDNYYQIDVFFSKEP